MDDSKLNPGTIDKIKQTINSVDLDLTEENIDMSNVDNRLAEAKKTLEKKRIKLMHFTHLAEHIDSLVANADGAEEDLHYGVLQKSISTGYSSAKIEFLNSQRMFDNLISASLSNEHTK